MIPGSDNVRHVQLLLWYNVVTLCKSIWERMTEWLWTGEVWTHVLWVVLCVLTSVSPAHKLPNCFNFGVGTSCLAQDTSCLHWGSWFQGQTAWPRWTPALNRRSDHMSNSGDSTVAQPYLWPLRLTVASVWGNLFLIELNPEYWFYLGFKILQWWFQNNILIIQSAIL